MIITVDGLNKHLFQPLLDDMFRLRARVFSGRLGWDVNIENEMEIDQFDRMNPTYFIGVDDELNVISCARVLQTTGPHMLSDVFSAILCGEAPVRSANIWESTRFCVDTERLKNRESKTAVSRATSELMLGILEYAQDSGITDIITVIDPIMDRVLKRSNNAPHGYVGKTVPMGKVKALAALLDCTDERIQNVRDFADIRGNIFVPEDEAVAKLEERKRLKEMGVAGNVIAKPAPTIADLQEYCFDQLADAADKKEAEAAVTLMNILKEKLGTNDIAELQRLAQDLPSGTTERKKTLTGSA